MLYVSLVRPVLEYCSVEWFSYNKFHTDGIESVQGTFYYKMRWRLLLQIVLNSDLSMVYRHIASMELQRTYNALYFMLKLC